MNKLSTIQKNHNLNTVHVLDTPHQINKGHHSYSINYKGVPGKSDLLPERHFIQFQNGPRLEPDSQHGILDTDLLEIVRHRIQSFQSGPFATRENAIALTHIEEALLWMNKRVEDRAEAQTLGTNKV
jgi:hypothetical protein